MATYLVTGSAGFIAARVCVKLLKDGHTVVGIDNLNNYYDVRLKYYRLSEILGQELNVNYSGAGLPQTSICGKFHFEKIDIEDKKALGSIFNRYQFDAVLNLAARAGVRYSLENPYVYLSTNAGGALNLLELMQDHNVRQFILASTSSLYAGSSLPFSELSPANKPISPYAASKKAAEMLAYAYHSLYGINTAVLRYFTVYGPAGRPDMAPFRFIKAIGEGTPLTLFGDGSQSRDFTYVDDIADGTISALNVRGFEIINLGGGCEASTVEQLIALLEELLGKKAKIIRQPANRADMEETQANIAKAKELLGWVPRVGFKAGVTSTVEWYNKNISFVKTITV